MRPLMEETVPLPSPETLVEQLNGEPGVVLLRSALFDSPQARYSFVAARPFLTFRCVGSRCEWWSEPEKPGSHIQFGNPWHALDVLMSRYELLEEIDLPFPLGGCFGYWGYDLKNFVEPRLTRLAINDLELPDCQVGFYDSVIVFDHRLAKTWVVSTGLTEDGSRSATLAQTKLDWWQEKLQHAAASASHEETRAIPSFAHDLEITSNLSSNQFVKLVQRAQEYIRSGDIYQVNLSHRLKATIGAISSPSLRTTSSPWPSSPRGRGKLPEPVSGDKARKSSFGEISPRTGERETAWACYRRLSDVSPAPFAAFVDCGNF